MNITVKLYSVFRLEYDNYNSYNGEKGLKVDLDRNSTILDLLRMLKIDPQRVSLVRVNERIVKDYNSILSSGDTIELFPFFGGG
ncbi:MAG: hypothetical protein C4554_02240 [Dethiobacter sp.]|jgi:thiamine biosynthesis protein ThiS|nr:MAG: hypothetical protein C4554_02240 [Dethiobacter sp.]